MSVDTELQTALLQAAGLSTLEERVYRALVTVPAADVTTLAEATGLSRAEVGETAHGLAGKGMIELLPGAASEYAALPPDVAMEPALARREEELRATRELLTELSHHYREVALQRRSTELVEVISGAAGIRQRFEHLQHHATTEVMALNKPPFLIGPQENHDALDMLARGVVVRGIYDRAALESGSGIEVLRRFVVAGEEIRVSEQLPIKLVIADGRTALLPLVVDDRRQSQSHALLVHRSALLTSLIEMFETLWSLGTPLPLDRDPGQEISGVTPPDPTERQILAMMFAGLTDQTIARQLGCSQRTLQRQIRALMDTHGARGRFHLGAIATERGLLG